MEGALKRVMLMERGALARRSVKVWRDFGSETVLAFGTEDAEAEWVDDADYAVYHGGSVGQADPAKLVSAAMDAGCDALDPGSLADNLDLLDLAFRSNLAVVGCDVHKAAHYRDPDWVLERAGEISVPGAPIGPWPESDTLRRRMDVWVLNDRQKGQIAVGPIETTLGPTPEDPWLLEHGDVPGPAARKAITEASAQLATRVGGAGLLRVRWGHLDETSWALRGFSSALGDGWPLVEAVHGFDAVWARVSCWRGGGGTTAALRHDRHGVCARIVAREAGVVDRLTLPQGGVAEVADGQEVAQGELLARVVVSAPTRQAALVRLGTTLDDVAVEGVACGLPALRDLVGDRDLWEGRLDAQAAAARLRG